MSFPEKVKLTKAGESITLIVSACGPASVGTYPEIEFTGKSGNRLVMVPVPKQSADRQLGRIPFSYQECVGATLTISRDANDKDASKPYWGITLAGSAPVRADSPPQATAPAAQTGHPDGGQPVKAESGVALYAKITNYVLDHVLPLYEEAGITPTMEGTAAICATLYIQANKNSH